jgi:hypothetical protein
VNWSLDFRQSATAFCKSGRGQEDNHVPQAVVEHRTHPPLTGRALKVTVVLDAGEVLAYHVPNTPRVILRGPVYVRVLMLRYESVVASLITATGRGTDRWT